MALTATAVVALAAVAIIHLVQILPTFKTRPLLDGAFVALIAAAVALAVRLVARSDSSTWIAVGVLSVGAIAGYVFTRAISSPLDNHDIGNWACILALASLFVETVLVAMSRYALAAKRTLRLAQLPLPLPTTAMVACRDSSSRHEARRGQTVTLGPIR
jgi:hypothetical protein